jgi:hypothetical protein
LFLLSASSRFSPLFVSGISSSVSINELIVVFKMCFFVFLLQPYDVKQIHMDVSFPPNYPAQVILVLSYGAVIAMVSGNYILMMSPICKSCCVIKIGVQNILKNTSKCCPLLGFASVTGV